MQVLLGGQAVQDVHHPAVRNQGDLLTHMLLGQALHGGGDAFAQLQQGFAATRKDQVGVALAPAVRVFGVRLRHLGKGAPFKNTKTALAQARLRVQGGLRARGQGLGGLPGALQVAAVNGGQGFIGQRLGRLLGLGLARGVQGNVGVALNAASRIPGGFAVPNGNDAGCVHGQEKKGGKKAFDSRVNPRCLQAPEEYSGECAILHAIAGRRQQIRRA